MILLHLVILKIQRISSQTKVAPSDLPKHTSIIGKTLILLEKSKKQKYGAHGVDFKANSKGLVNSKISQANIWEMCQSRKCE